MAKHCETCGREMAATAQHIECIACRSLRVPLPEEEATEEELARAFKEERRHGKG